MEPELRGSATRVILSRSVLCAKLLKHKEHCERIFAICGHIMKETLSQLFYQFIGGGGDRERKW